MDGLLSKALNSVSTSASTDPAVATNFGDGALATKREVGFILGAAESVGGMVGIAASCGYINGDLAGLPAEPDSVWSIV